MKKHVNIFVALLSALLVCFLISAPLVFAASAWQIETVDSIGEVGEWSSLALDSSGTPHISYRDMTNNDVKYASWDGSAWIIQTVTGDQGWYTSLDLDAIGNPHISYTDVSNADLKYASWTGTSWAIETVDSAGVVGAFSCLALDSSGNPHISYHAWSADNLKYARWDGSAWETETIASGGYDGTSRSLALDTSGNPHISYYERGNKDLKYASLLPCATVVSVWTTDASGTPKVSFNSEPVYVHWQADGAVNITVRYQDGTVDAQWLNLGTSGVKSFSPSHGNGFYNVTCTACTQQTMIAYGSFLFVVPEYLLGTLMALTAPLLATVSYHAITKRKKKT